MASEKVLRLGMFAAVIGAGALASPVCAQDWVFQPAIGVDQRFDDNFSLIPVGEEAVSVTRLVGDLGWQRDSATLSMEAILRADLRLQVGDTDDTAPDFNGLALFSVERSLKRSRFSFNGRVTQDTPSDDIVSNVTDPSDVAGDSAVVTQSFDVERLRVDLSPSFGYDLSRRSTVRGSLSYTNVEHETPGVQDTLFEEYLDLLSAGGDNPPTPQSNPELFDENGDEFTRDTVTSEQTGQFVAGGELDDYSNTSIRLAYRYQLDRISSITLTAGLSRFVAEEEVDNSALVADDLDADSGEPNILRAPRVDTVDTTTRLTAGYVRSLSKTLTVNAQLGVYNNSSDDTERFRRDDGTVVEDALTSTDDDGFLGSLSFSKDSGLTQYTARFSIDVLPSSAGSSVETTELVGQVFRTISPLLDVSLRGQAYEPDRLGAGADDRFARRFISIEPRVIWRFARNWTFGAAYRYRRQRAEIDTMSSESNALLFSLRYVQPSKLRDLAAGR